MTQRRLKYVLGEYKLIKLQEKGRISASVNSSEVISKGYQSYTFQRHNRGR